MSSEKNTTQPVMTIHHNESNTDGLPMIKGNILVEGWFDVTAYEYMLIQTTLYLISQKNENREFYDANTIFKITVDDFIKIWGTENRKNNTGLISSRLKEVAMSIMQKGFWYADLDTNKPTFSLWFSQVTPLNDGALNIAFPPAIIKYLKMVNKKFTWYDLKRMRELKKVYSFRLYELLSQHKYSIGQVKDNYIAKNNVSITIEDLRARFGIQDKYPIISDLKKRVIDSSIKEIKEKTGLEITATPIKNGKTIVAFEFNYTFPSEDLDFKSAFNITEKHIEYENMGIVNMSDKTRKLFASKLTNHQPFMLNYENRHLEDKALEKAVFEDLKKSDFIEANKEYLDALGFDPDFAKNNQKPS